MMIAQPKLYSEEFQTMLACHFSRTPDAGGLLQRSRKNAWEAFEKIGLPTIKSEVFRYMTLRKLYTRSFERGSLNFVEEKKLEPYILPECQDSVLVFVNGCFEPRLSHLQNLPKKAKVLPISEAANTYGAFLNNQWTKTLKDETDPFYALCCALYGEGAFLYLPPKTIVETPVQILQVIDTQETPMAIMPRFQLFAGSQSQINLCTTQAKLSSGDYWMNTALDFAIEEDSQVQYTQSQFNRPEDAWEFEAVRATLKRDSILKTFLTTDGGGTIRNDYRVSLTGENGEASLNGVWMLADKREAHTHILMDHQAPHCRSMQFFKGVLNDTSRSAFEGKILVRQPAQKTEAYQLNNNLLMSDYATADSKPNLEIFADDVKASHGATVGQLDEEQLFYMKTRGFNEKVAKNLLINGFCSEVITQVPLASLREIAQSKAHRFLKED